MRLSRRSFRWSVVARQKRGRNCRTAAAASASQGHEGDSGRRKIHSAAAHHERDPGGERNDARGAERGGDEAERERHRGRPRRRGRPGDAAAIDGDAADEDAARLAARRIGPRRRLHGDAAGAAAAQQVAAGDGDRQRLPAGGERRLRDARAVDEHLDGVARPRLDRLQLQRDAGGQRRAGQLDAPEAGRPAAGQAAMRGCRPEAGEEGRVAGRPRTMADDSGAATSSAAKTRAAATAAPAPAFARLARGLRRGEPARVRRGAVGHRRTTSSPCSSWGRPSEPVREQ